MPELSYSTPPVAPKQPPEVETIPMVVTHAEMLAQSLTRCPDYAAAQSDKETKRTNSLV